MFAVAASAQPAFKGGQRTLTSFINNNQIYPEYSKANCLQGTVQVSFKLDSRGNIYESQIEKGFGTDLDLEALRVVRLTSGRWIMPAAHDTLTSLVLPVNFALKDYKCEEVSQDQKNTAINAWHARKGMTEGIFNYYDKKQAGTHDPADEYRIQEIKLQLGYDDKFIERLLKQGKTKLKQGDREGACEDFQTIRRLGNDRSADLIGTICKNEKASTDG